jgi:hypothetical protein
METDPKKELEKASKGVSGDPSGDLDELALKFLGLGIFYGAAEKAKSIAIQRSDGYYLPIRPEGWRRDLLDPVPGALKI